MSGAEASETFGCSPLIVHCWACMCDGVVGSQKTKNPLLYERALKLLISAPESQVWSTQANFEKRAEQDYSNYCFPPGPAAIYEDLALGKSASSLE